MGEKATRNGGPQFGACFRERPPGLIQHVLTVLVFWSSVLLCPLLPPSSRSLRLFPWSSILLYGPLGNCLDLLPAAPHPHVQKRAAQHTFLQHRGAHAECLILSEHMGWQDGRWRQTGPRIRNVIKLTPKMCAHSCIWGIGSKEAKMPGIGKRVEKRGLNLWHGKDFFAPTPSVRQPLFETSDRKRETETKN